MRSRVRASTATLTTTEAVVLGLLAEEDRSGYDLLKRAESSVAYIWSPAKSHVYAVLPRLVDAGLAHRRDVKQQTRPDKQLYKLTREGRAALRHWLEDVPPRNWDELMLKVFFAGLASPERIVARLREFADEQRRLLDEYAQIRPKTVYGGLTLEYGLRLMPVRLRWLDDAMKELSA